MYWVFPGIRSWEKFVVVVREPNGDRIYVCFLKLGYGVGVPTECPGLAWFRLYGTFGSC